MKVLNTYQIPEKTNLPVNSIIDQLLGHVLAGVYEYPQLPLMTVNDAHYVMQMLINDTTFPWLLFDAEFNPIIYQIALTVASHHTVRSTVLFTPLGVSGFYTLNLNQDTPC